jgi:hypothetical protein
LTFLGKMTLLYANASEVGVMLLVTLNDIPWWKLAVSGDKSAELEAMTLNWSVGWQLMALMMMWRSCKCLVARIWFSCLECW